MANIITAESKAMAYTTISDLSVDEFKNLIREIVEETITDLFADPDAGLELRDEMVAYLQTSSKSLKSGKINTDSAAQVAANLGLEW